MTALTWLILGLMTPAFSSCSSPLIFISAWALPAQLRFGSLIGSHLYILADTPSGHLVHLRTMIPIGLTCSYWQQHPLGSQWLDSAMILTWDIIAVLLMIPFGPYPLLHTSACSPPGPHQNLVPMIPTWAHRLLKTRIQDGPSLAPDPGGMGQPPDRRCWKYNPHPQMVAGVPWNSLQKALTVHDIPQ